MVKVDAAFILRRAADLAPNYDRHATGVVLFNPTNSFHLCGLIERAASLPRSGATHRRSMDSRLVDEAKATFCRVHRVVHPATWEFEGKRTWQNVQSALRLASEAGLAKPNDYAG